MAREILRTGDWLVLHHPYYTEWSNFYEHPPLYMWLTAISFKIFGTNDFAAKFFSASMGFGTIIIVYYAAKQIKDSQFAFISAFALLTTQYFWDYARKARLEIPLTFWMALAFFLIVLAYKKKSHWWSLGGGTAVAFAFLTKGIPALSMFGAAFFMYILGFGVSLTGLAFFCSYIAGFLLIIAPWSVLQYIYDEGRFFDWYIFRQVAWSVGGRGQSVTGFAAKLGSYFYYLNELAFQIMIPWFAAAVYGAYRLLRRVKFKESFLRYMPLLTAVIIIIAFTIIPFKKGRYILPAVPFLCMTAAEAFTGWRRNAKFSLWLKRITLVLTSLIIFAALFLPVKFSTQFKTDLKTGAGIIREYTVPGDTMIVYGEKTYSMMQMYTWYIDRPQIQCDSPEDFTERLNTGRYTGLFYGGYVSPDSVKSRPSVIIGDYSVFLSHTDEGSLKIDR